MLFLKIVMTSSSLSISTSSNSTVYRPSSCGLGAYGSNPYHSGSTTSLMTPSWLLYSLEWIRWLYYAYIAHSRLRVEQSTQTVSSIPHIHHDHCPCRGKWTAKHLFALAIYISQHALRGYVDTSAKHKYDRDACWIWLIFMSLMRMWSLNVIVILACDQILQHLAFHSMYVVPILPQRN